MSDAEFFSKSRAALIESVAGFSPLTARGKLELDRNHSLAAFIDLMTKPDFRIWFETELDDYISQDGDVTIGDIIKYLVDNLRG